MQGVGGYIIVDCGGKELSASGYYENLRKNFSTGKTIFFTNFLMDGKLCTSTPVVVTKKSDNEFNIDSDVFSGSVRFSLSGVEAFMLYKI